jgi:hypothetical protein
METCMHSRYKTLVLCPHSGILVELVTCHSSRIYKQQGPEGTAASATALVCS